MSPELLNAIKERITLGYVESHIKQELKEAGYDEVTIKQAYTQAYKETHTNPEEKEPEPASEGHKSHEEQLVSESTTETVVSPDVESDAYQPPRPESLPGLGALLNNGFKFMASRLDLVLILAIPSLVITATNYFTVSDLWTDQLFVLISVFVLILIAVVFSVLNIGALLYTIIKSQDRRVDYSEALAWTRRNIWGLIWVMILTTVVVWGGFMLFIIPGLILGVYLSLANFVFAKEGLRGINALQRSRALIKDNWWAVFGRTLGISIILMLLLIAVGMLLGFVVGISSDLTANSPEAGLMIEIVMSIMYIIFSMVSTHAGMEMHRALVSNNPVTQSHAKLPGRWKYVTLAWIGALLPIFLVLVAVVLASLNSARNMSIEAVQSSEITEFRDQASVYYQDHASYVGVCGYLDTVVRQGDFSNQLLDCSESPNGWTILIKSEEISQTYCVDTDSVFKANELRVDSSECSADGEETEFSKKLDAKKRALEMRFDNF